MQPMSHRDILTQCHPIWIPNHSPPPFFPHSLAATAGRAAPPFAGDDHPPGTPFSSLPFPSLPKQSVFESDTLNSVL